MKRLLSFSLALLLLTLCLVSCTDSSDEYSSNSGYSSSTIENIGSNDDWEYFFDDDYEEDDDYEDNVWIPKSGKKYHSSKKCSGMKNPSSVTVATAKQKGYTACKKCFG